ncbi:MAG: flagellar assembly peptidoglycan hydrolase FlgJ [Castellaniella sp.]|uniref:flagellar assembly peptidoglycan hydrolase FlgJ n=1 Tax=Castellaniella sp. TaxID=1955812 RepID=UPI002A35F35B|nr:flagellar assembly peptidoglycan hydrolase FlgJ [Castellaniella sp.]MDY0310138.1 flagellar assembly peptidoglycan hydrolase FlgJ [Castellaniella sp.]
MEFVSQFPLPTPDATPSALDFSSLNALKQGVRAGGRAAQDPQREVARQFEAIFIQMMLKQARQHSAQMPSLFDSQATRMAQSMSDEQAALVMANPGLGLADALMAQMQGGVLTSSGSLGSPPEAARSRLPALQSCIGEGRREMADSIGALIDGLARRGAGERIGGAIQGAPAHIRAFVDRMGAAAELAARRSGVPARLILSQAALESGWGEREIRRPDGRSSHNLFGIKAGGSWRGDVVHVMTTEYDEDGVAHRLSQPFRAYGSYAESFQDYAELIGSSDRYGKVVTAPSAEAAARRIQEAGYATDPGYADKLISIMGYFNAR